MQPAPFDTQAWWKRANLIADVEDFELRLRRAQRVAQLVVENIPQTPKNQYIRILYNVSTEDINSLDAAREILRRHPYLVDGYTRQFITDPRRLRELTHVYFYATKTEFFNPERIIEDSKPRPPRAI